jgi:hypothetical protein|tara:strand:- start:251 stop:421 length:171 start_codon:yes stop_codon:yes gene_type:complete
MKEEWEKATNRVIAANLIESLEKLLEGQAKHYVCSDKTTMHEKIVIEYGHKRKEKK